MKRDDLPVEICQRNGVIINEIERSDAAAAECFRNISADAPDTEYSYAAASELLHSGFPEEQGSSCKLILHDSTSENKSS